MRAEETNDFSLFVTSFYLKLTGIWSAASPEEERQRWNAFIFTMTFMFLGAYTELRELYYAWGNSFEDTIFALCNIVTVCLVLCKITTLYVKKSKFYELLAYSESNFWHTNYDSREKMYLDECRGMCVLFICFFNFFAQGTAFSYTIEPLVAYFGNNATARSLPFNLHSDVVMKPYIYEITFLSQIFVLVAYGIGYLCVDNFMCIANFHAATQFRILQYRITSIRGGHKMEKHSETTISRLVPGYYADDCYVIFKDCIKQHQSLIAYCEKVEEVFTLIVLGQVLLFSILICLDGYLMLLEEASFYRRMVFTFHLIGCISQLLMFTYSCDCVLRESMEIAESVYDTQWTILPLNTGGKMLRTDLQLVMLRSRMPCCLTAGGFFMVSLETYTKVLSTAASYFTLLRQLWVACNINVGCSKLKMIEVQTDDFAISVASFFMKVAGFWMYVDQAEKRRRNITLFYTVALILFSVYVQVTDFYYTEDDFIGYLFLLVNILTVIGVLFKIFVLLPHRENFFRLVVHLQRHFLNAEYDEYEKTIMHRCKRLCAIFVGLITLFVHLTGICYAVSPVIANIGKNESDRVLPFNMWVNIVPITMTPYYEIAFTVEVLALYQICVTYFCFDNCLCIMNLHVASQFRILQYRLAHLRCIYEKRNSVGGLKICAIMPTKDVYGTLKRYVHQHQVLIAFCKKLEEIFNLVVLGDILAFSIVICLNGCQALMIDSARRFIFIFFLLTSFVHLLMFTYSCDVVMHESLKVAAGIYDSPWCYLTFNDHGRMLRKDVVLIIMRCKFPCCITARRFFPVTLETYTKVWSTAASYFTLLRQTLDDMAHV
ncbi:uncharacterized protein LOC117228400 [Megalopta genalis]|uniref:uncharacterized protein LOC117228400 n=1 Tax=Megalopta genalis TaxID=115081 RepID=UPI003FD34E5F